MIEVKRIDKNRYVKIDELPIGSVFRLGTSERVFMKITNIYDFNESIEYNAIALNYPAGEPIYIDSDDNLIEVDVNLTIKDIKNKEED